MSVDITLSLELTRDDESGETYLLVPYSRGLRRDEMQSLCSVLSAGELDSMIAHMEVELRERQKGKH